MGVGIRKTTGNHGGTSVTEAAALYLTPMIDGMKLDEFERVFGLFDEAVRNSEMLTDIREELETRQRLAPGRIAPVFSLAQMLSLADLAVRWCWWTFGQAGVVRVVRLSLG